MPYNPKPVLVSMTSFGLIGAAVVVGCRSGGTETDTTTSAHRVDRQIARGADVFANTCAKCHGQNAGGSTRAPALVGEGALSQFATASDLAQFVTENMPADNPGSLETSEYWAVLAFALNANGIELTAPVDQESAPTIELR